MTDYSITVLDYLYGDSGEGPEELSVSQEGGEGHYDSSLPLLVVGNTYVLLLYPWDIDGKTRLFIAHPVGLYQVTETGLAVRFWPVTPAGRKRPTVNLEQLLDEIRAAAARAGR